MKASDRDDLRRRLEARAREILHHSHLDVREADEAMPFPDNVPDAVELALSDQVKTTQADMSERDRNLLVQIRDAFGRMRDGEYGVCVECGEEIALERLRAVPWAARCANDQERVEEARDTADPGANPTL